VALSPDGRLLLTGCEDGLARLFRVNSGSPLGRPLGHEGTVPTVAFRRDGRAALTASAGGDHYAAARLWELPAGRGEGPVLEHTAVFAVAVAFSPDGKELLTGNQDRTARLWDVASGREVGPRLPHPHEVWGVAFAPDGGTVLTVCLDRQVRLWDRRTGRLLHPWPHAGAAAFSPDGRAVLTADEAGAQVWDAATGEKSGPRLGHPKAVCGAGFSEDGRTVWTAAADDTLRQWDRDTGRLLAASPVPASLSWAVFGPGGRAALAHDGGRYVQLRDRTAGGDAGPVLAHPAGVILGLAFSPDALLVASAGGDRTARLWDADTGRPIGAPLPHPPLALSRVAFRPDGRMLAVAGEARTHLWEVGGPVGGTTERVRVWVEEMTGLRLDDQNGVRRLSAEEQRQRRRELDRLGGPPESGAP
jgi:WD40 repeat protein